LVKKLVILLLLLGAGLAGLAWWWRHQNGSANGTAYTTMPVEFGKLIDTVNATGIVQPRQTYAVGAEASGRVVEIAADFNQEVEEGAILLRLDDQVLRQQRYQAQTAVEAARIGVKQSEAQRDTARKVLEREQTRPPELKREIEVQILANQLASAEATLEGARNKVKQAEQALVLSELALAKTIVRAPILKGIDRGSAIGSLVESESSSQTRRKFLVLDRKVSLGQMVGPPLQAHLYTLAGDLDIMQIDAQVAEGDVSKVGKGQSADFTVASYSDSELHFTGTVRDVRMLPINDRGAVFYKVILEAKNERDPATNRWRLTPGVTATVDIIRREHDNIWKLPTMALSFQPDESKLSEAVREKLQRWHNQKKPLEGWRTVWIVGKDRSPWPVFVRVGGTNMEGDTGIRDASSSEVLEWDPELSLDAGKPETFPQVIIAAPAPKAGLFNPPNLKL
jgi:HlyD family secretion protein